MASNELRDFYKPGTLTKWFGITSMIMMVATIWMLLDDFGRDWKGYQREFFVLQKAKYDKMIEEANAALDPAALKEAEERLAKAKAETENQAQALKAIDAELVKLKTREKNLTVKYQTQKAVFDVRKYEYEAKYGHKVAEGHEDTSPKALAAKKKLDDFFAQVTELKNAANGATQEVEAKVKERQSLLAAMDEAQKELSKVRGKVDQLVAAKEGSELTLSKVLRSAPIVDMANPTFRLQQIVVPTIRDDIFFAQTQKVDRCTTCHMAIDRPGFENEPNPFKTHPRLDLMLSGASPHPMDKVGCTVCHEGRGPASNFIRAAHMPQNEEQKKEWVKKYGWNEHALHHIPEKMLPLQYTEGKCRTCHKSQEYAVGGEKYVKSVQLIKAAGCYGCHKIEGWEHVRKPAPSLERVKGKLTRQWIYKWIKNPRSFNEHARMPSSFLQSNITTEQFQRYQEAEMQAIADFLLAESESYDPGVHRTAGNAERGKQLFGTVGCLACHQIDDYPRTRGRFGQAPDLTTVGSKVGRDWMMQWLKNPRHYWEGTTMPSFRLTDQEAADVTDYLMSKRNPDFEAAQVPEPDVEAQKDVLRRYFERDPKLAPVTNDKVEKVIAELKPHEVGLTLGKNAVMRYGCYGCHDIKGMQGLSGIGPELSEVGSKPLTKFDFGLLHMEHSNVAWFHAKLENPRIFDKGLVREYLDLLRMPDYGFTPDERSSLVLSLMGMSSQKILPPGAKEMKAHDTLIEEGLRVVHKYNCQGCHVIEQLHKSLPEGHPDWEKHEQAKYDLEGRILKYYEEDETLGPPPLVTQGARTHTDWVYRFLQNPGANKLRERLDIRMPSFNMPTDEWNAVLRYWAAHGKVQFPMVENQRVNFTPQRLADAKALFGKLACLSCHTAGERLTRAEMEGGSKGLAPDLLLAHKRLRRAWIVELLKDPQKMIPGTRMPGFWPDGQTPAPEILNGDSKAQMELIADYVIYLGQSRGGGAASSAPAASRPKSNVSAENRVETPARAME